MKKQALAEFVEALWMAYRTSQVPEDPAVQMGLRAFRIFLGEDKLPELVTDTEAIAQAIENLADGRKRLINKGDMSPLTEVPLTKVVADRLREYAVVWRSSPPLPFNSLYRPPTRPTEPE